MNGLCIECRRGFLCGVCKIPTPTTAGASNEDSPGTESTNSDESGNDNEAGSGADDSAKPQKVRSQKRDAALKDQQSTGRKRAARAYPLHRDQPCEWRNKVGQGGGNFPIKGCDNGLQQSRHHGPDKNTLNNEDGNVHRICHTCHNRWHAANDPNYIPGKPIRGD